MTPPHFTQHAEKARERRRMHAALRRHSERQERQRRQRIERLIQLQRDRQLRVFRPGNP